VLEHRSELKDGQGWQKLQTVQVKRKHLPSAALIPVCQASCPHRLPCCMVRLAPARSGSRSARKSDTVSRTRWSSALSQGPYFPSRKSGEAGQAPHSQQDGSGPGAALLQIAPRPALHIPPAFSPLIRAGLGTSRHKGDELTGSARDHMSFRSPIGSPVCSRIRRASVPVM